MAVYLDCAATTPLDPEVGEEVFRCLHADFGNAGSRTHDYGRRARAVVESGRDRIAAVLACSRGDVVFTSGATESNNLAILGLAQHGERTGRRHILSTAIEHHAVLGPLAEMKERGFDIELIAPDSAGVIDAATVQRSVRPDTLLVSIMHVNNETGMMQPIDDIATGLQDSDAVFHVDAAQSFGREIDALRHPRIDLMSVSGHKIHAPKGVGALVVRRRDGSRPALQPLMRGGGQERGLRPGTLPVALIAGLGKAAELALVHSATRARECLAFRERMMAGLSPLQPAVNGDPRRSVPHIVNLSIPGIDAEAVIDAWHDLAAISHGAACTLQTYSCSHVLSAMNLPEWRQDGALRISWCHFSDMPDLPAMVAAVEHVRDSAMPHSTR